MSSPGPDAPPIPCQARELASELGELFRRDAELCAALNDAQARTYAALDQLTSGLSADALRGIYGPQGPDLGLSGHKPPVLQADSPVAALEAVADQARRAHIDYQNISEDRRALATDVGELLARLTAAMVAAGHNEHDIRCADVDELAHGRLTVHDADQDKR